MSCVGGKATEPFIANSVLLCAWWCNGRGLGQVFGGGGSMGVVKGCLVRPALGPGTLSSAARAPEQVDCRLRSGRRGGERRAAQGAQAAKERRRLARVSLRASVGRWPMGRGQPPGCN